MASRSGKRVSPSALRKAQKVAGAAVVPDIAAQGSLRCTSGAPFTQPCGIGSYLEASSGTWALSNAANVRVHPSFAYRLQLWVDGAQGAKPFNGMAMVSGSVFYEPAWIGYTLSLAVMKNGAEDTTTLLQVIDNSATDTRTHEFVLFLPLSAVEGDAFSLAASFSLSTVKFRNLAIHANFRG